MAEGLFMQVKKQMKKDPRLKFKKFYKPLPHEAEIQNGDKLLVWRTGGIGDILFITTILNHIKKIYPETIIKFGCAKQYQPILVGLDFIDRVIDLPLHLNNLRTCDYSIIFENIIENNPKAEKMNCYDLMSQQFNIDFQDVERKFPVIYVQDEPRQLVDNWIKEQGIQDKRLILIHQRASSPIRTPTVHFSSDMVGKLVEGLPEDCHFLIIDMPQQEKIVDKYINTWLTDYKDRITNVSSISKDLSITMAIVERMSCVVGIDSSMMHFAAGLEVPAVGLYGPFKSDLRVRYYPKTIGLDATHHCCPCFKHGHEHCDEAKKINGGIGAPCFSKIPFEKIVNSVNYLLEKFNNA